MNTNTIKLILVVLVAGLVLNTTATAVFAGADEHGSMWAAIGAIFTTSAETQVARADVEREDDAERADKANKLQDEAASKTQEQLASATKRVQDASPTASLATASIPRAVYNVTVTAYSSSVDETDSTPFITASNSRVRDGVIAANFLPFGTRVKIPDLYGDKVFIVEDRMNRRFTNRVDIWMPSKWQAKNFGKRSVRIEVL